MRFLGLVFIISVFFKLGVTPFHLFKVEVYKGIPLLSIFFYTTYYFIVFFFILSSFFFRFFFIFKKTILFYSIVYVDVWYTVCIGFTF